MQIPWEHHPFWQMQMTNVWHHNKSCRPTNQEDHSFSNKTKGHKWNLLHLLGMISWFHMVSRHLFLKPPAKKGLFVIKNCSNPSVKICGIPALNGSASYGANKRRRPAETIWCIIPKLLAKKCSQALLAQLAGSQAAICAYWLRDPQVMEKYPES